MILVGLVLPRSPPENNSRSAHVIVPYLFDGILTIGQN